MELREIQDWQFGLISWNEDYKCYKAVAEWIPGSNIELCIYINGNKINKKIEYVRTMFDSLKEKREEIPLIAAQELLAIYNDILSDNENPTDIQTFISNIQLNQIIFYQDSISLIYIDTTGQAPLITVNFSPELNFKSALFD